MNTFTLVQRALDATLDDPSKRGLDTREIEIGRIVGAVQTVVDALTPPDGGRYIVGFADISTAGTNLGERRITVSSKPLRDPSLSLVEKAVVIATFAAHEIGHTLVTRPRRDLVEQHNGHSGYHAVANLADDIILEPVMVDRFPILKDAFTFTGTWVLRATAKQPLPKQHRLTRDMTTPERFNLLLSATRYGDIAEIVFPDTASCDERDWSRGWADRLIAARLDDHTTFLALCDEAWERIRSTADVPDDEPEPEPEPEPTGEGDEDGEEVEVEVEVSEDEDEDGQPDEGEGDPGESDEGDDEDGDGGSDEDTDGDDATDGDDEDEDGEDGDGESSDEDEDGDESDDSESDGAGDEGDESEEDGESEDGDGEADGNDGSRDWDDDEDDESDDESDGTTDGGESMDGADESDAEGDESDESDEVDSDNADIPDDAEGGGGDPTTSEGARDEDDFDKDEVDESMHDSAEREPYDWNAQQADEAVRTYASTTVTAFGKHGSLSTIWE